MDVANIKPLKIVVAALGGQGGGVLAGWIATLARNAGWPCQTTSVPGVAQRTGATIYYIEMFPVEKGLLPAEPVLSLFPTKGDVDIVVASEIVEAGRMIERGFVTPQRTTLIASGHRVYSVSERIDLGDATIAVAELETAATARSKQLILFDMQQLADDHQTLISASLFGALGGAQCLPFDKAKFQSIVNGAANQAAFEAAYTMAQQPQVQFYQPEKGSSQFTLPEAASMKGANLLAHIRDMPDKIQETVYFGAKKLNNYLDHNYAADYLQQVDTIARADETTYTLTNEFARILALWSSHEDIIRVAHLKVKASRVQKLSHEVGAEPDQILHVKDFFKPRVEEICGLLPKSLGNFCLNSNLVKRFLTLFTSGKQLPSTNIGVFLALRAIAGLRRFRRGTLAFVIEETKRRSWVNVVQAHLDNPSKALAITQLAAIVKGYGATRERGYAQIERVLPHCEKLSVEEINRLHSSALEDDAGHHFDQQCQALQIA